jgi:hypothetical protein
MWQRQNHLPNKKNRQYLDAFALRSSSVPNLSQDVSSKYLRDGFTQHPPQTKQAWGAKEENPKGKTVIPFRRPGGRKAPHGVPKLDLSVLGLNRDVFEPIVLLEDDSPSSQTSPVDATVEETTKKEVVGDEDDVPSSPQQPKFVPSFEAAKKKVVISESQDRRYTPQPGSTDLLRKVEFKCFMVTRSGRDIHRDLTGYFFPSDNTLAVYEVKQLAKKPSAFALFERKSYSHLNGKLKGMCYTLGDISEVSAVGGTTPTYVYTHFFVHLSSHLYTPTLVNSSPISKLLPLPQLPLHSATPPPHPPLHPHHTHTNTDTFQYLLNMAKPTSKDHSRDQVMVVSVDRWSLYRGALVSLRWPMG